MTNAVEDLKDTQSMNDQSEIHIDRHSPVIATALDKDGQIYRKTGEIIAERAVSETPVVTVLADGSTETRNRARPGDYIVTGSGGERYVVKPETFAARYAPKPGEKGVYVALGQIVAVENPFERPIAIMASWGEKQHGSADCMIADIFDPNSKLREGQPYIIARSEFENTYARL
jgi:hypothetical protein